MRLPARRRRGLTAAGAVAVTGALLFAAALPAAAVTTPVSQAHGFFLSGIAGGQDLGQAVRLTSADAVNTGGPPVTSSNPLSVTLGNQATIPIGQVNLPIGAAKGLTLGAVNQVASASPDGSAMAASGAVADNGAINVGGTSGPPADAKLDLADLASTSGLPAQLTSALTTLGDVSLTAGALAGRAVQGSFGNGSQKGTYRLGSLVLTITGNSQLTSLYSQAKTPIDTYLGAVTAALPTGAVLTTPLPTSDSLLTGLTNVSGGGLQADLATGTVVIDLAALIKANSGYDINTLPPNTDLLPIILGALPKLGDAVLAQLTGLSGSSGITGIGSLTALPAPVVPPVVAVPVALSTLVPGFGDLQTALDAALTQLSSGFKPGLDTLSAALAKLLGLTGNGQSLAGGTFTETALRITLLPSASTGATGAAPPSGPAVAAPAAGGPALPGPGAPSGSGVPTALVLNLGSASVGPGAALAAGSSAPVATPTPTAGTPSVPQLANTGPHQTLSTTALGALAVATGMAVLAAAGAAVRRRSADRLR